jgi:putative Mn2+ efflux pump MntP
VGFLLLGVDSLIACIAIGPIIGRRAAVPLALLFGVGDGGGFLLGSAFHWSVPDNVSNVVETGVLLALGIYWIAIAILSRQVATAEQQSRSRWGVWILPWVLSIDNITYGIVDGVPAHATVWQSAAEQALSSAVQAGIGLAIGMAIAVLFPAVRRRLALANGICGGALIAAAGVLLALNVAGVS